MEILAYLLLGLVQGLTEFLPVSSSGHLELGKALLGLESEDLTFTVLVHAATALSTLVVFRRDIWLLLSNMTQFGVPGKEARKYLGLLLLSAIPVAVVGFGFKDEIEGLSTTPFVGMMLCCTALILFLSQKTTTGNKSIRAGHAIVVGLAQAVATLPGISRSGSTIGASLVLGISREEAARFSFLMALIPIVGATLLEIMELTQTSGINPITHTQWVGYAAGTLTAFFSGWVACTWMIRLVQKSNLSGFAVYCLLIGVLALILH